MGVVIKCAFFLFLASYVAAQPKTFDIATYGGKPGGDITEVCN